MTATDISAFNDKRHETQLVQTLILFVFIKNKNLEIDIVYAVVLNS